MDEYGIFLPILTPAIVVLGLIILVFGVNLTILLWTVADELKNILIDKIERDVFHKPKRNYDNWFPRL